LDAETEQVVQTLKRICADRRKTPEAVFKGIVQQALDEVIDGPRTGRFSIDQLEKTEKTYVGTKIEIILRSELELEKGDGIDLVVGGIPVDVKWSETQAWMIARENVGKICLGVGLRSRGTAFGVGVFRASPHLLRSGQNQDKKSSLSAAGRRTIHWMVDGAPLDSNFLAGLPDNVRDAIFSERSAQERVRKLVTLVQNTFIPRSAFATVAMGKQDPMRRLRQDKHNSGGLGGIRLLSTKYGKAELARMSYTNPPKDHWMAVPAEELRKRTK
jgi:hypothetical protein